MKNHFCYLLLTLFFGVNSLAQKTVELSVCDDLPIAFYKTNYTHIYIENGMGYCDSPLKELDWRIANFKNLEELTYISDVLHGSNKAARLPAEIEKLVRLKSLQTNVPNAEVFGLSNLTNLNLTINDVEAFELIVEEGFERLPNLTSLSLRFASTFPKDYELSGINDLKKLKSVELFNPNQHLVDAVTNIAGIENLVIRYTKGVTFDFSKLPALKFLSMDVNELIEIPPSLYECRNLEELSITSNSITVIKDGIGQLKKLRVLRLWHNYIKTISTEIENCVLLEEIYLNYNRGLTALPTTIGALQHLKIVEAPHCSLLALPQSIGQCTALVKLNVTHNKLTEINVDFSQMTSLEVAFLNENQITYIDSSLFGLSTVKKLNIATNKLTKLPNTIGRMNSLEIFDLFKNEITNLPEDIGSLSKLERLSAYNNEIEFLPNSIVECKKLATLYLGNNQLTTLPINFDKLDNIHSLELQNNPFIVFPAAIYKIAKLEMVWISAEHCYLKGFSNTKKNPRIIITN